MAKKLLLIDLSFRINIISHYFKRQSLKGRFFLLIKMHVLLNKLFDISKIKKSIDELCAYHKNGYNG